MNKYKILIIEDDKGIREILNILLEDFYDVSLAVNGIDGLKKAIRNPPDLILLDLIMPELDGFQVCKALREDDEFSDVPIMIITGLNNSEDRTKLFGLGVDDFISKPFNSDELLARIQRRIQRSSALIENESQKSQIKKSVIKPTAQLVSAGKLKIEFRNQEVLIDNLKIPLSAIELKLFHFLANNYNNLVNRENIVEWVWEKQTVSPRLIDPHILSLRRKLKESNLTIQALYGKGYILKNI
ncbi:MAG: response regulator transcription factor [Rhizobacter sp.]|nr:response regulator transcription factor [Bacteriovorax sp.]